ncbi:hypothetical protein Acr_05g0008150 [Actinidia rufa]|uniref:RING-type domain-containing protein n=1 Tax=Actinidia rufa TaxID=165716 RepID=A0A7J0ELY4_9ERIC|nr:hypothetical protein Acr_05g0008150 [Actinidia rufa]
MRTRRKGNGRVLECGYIQLTSIARIRSNLPNEELPTQLLPYRDLSILITGKYTAFSKGKLWKHKQVSQDDVEKLPCFDFKAREKGSSPVDCAVCLESFKAGDKCRLLPLCRHSFHAQCVDLWLLKVPICPICRASADAGKGGSVSGEESSNSIGIGIEFGDSQATESGRFSELAVELRESQTAMSETDHLSDPGVRMRESQILESTT